MKQLVAFLLFACGARLGFAQTPTRWQQHADSIFQHIDRTPVSTGLLSNYGYALKDLAPFQGASLSTANRLQSLLEWRLLYAALQTKKRGSSLKC